MVGSIVLIALIGLGIEWLVNPLLLGYLMIVGYVLLGVFEAWEPRLEELRGGAPEEDGASAKEQREDSDPAHGRLSVAPGEHLPRLSELRRTP